MQDPVNVDEDGGSVDVCFVTSAVPAVGQTVSADYATEDNSAIGTVTI